MQGWRCASSEPVTLDVLHGGEGDRPVFYRCRLAEGNAIPGLEAETAGADLSQTSGGAGGWRLAFGDRAEFVADLRLRDLVVMVDAGRHPVDLRGTLDHPATLSGRTHPTGTAVRATRDRGLVVPSPRSGEVQRPAAGLTGTPAGTDEVM
ncbi:hypothetical protein SAMN05443573_11237 [Celeribacter indicus]|uniref:Uncharacterized protein n=1 Tax=Celeribacter indicus TaxID=1208324 RepID=A0A0B5E147_9RHOB|nr:hypothetical protein P73_2016 [Celeribacter indicus]SDX05047.1 hypothetical protein SAMN05443573_11237 [Celeribacter indicus]